MIPVPYYTTVYYILISLLTLFLCGNLYTANNERLENSLINKIWCIVLLFTVILFIGLRDPWGSPKYFADTQAYSRTFIDYTNNVFADIWAEKDIGFHYFMKLCASFLDISMFYLLCAFLYVYPVYITMKRWFEKFAIYALFVYVVSMSFWSFGINGVRTGLAASFFIFALGNINRKWIAILFMLLAISMHKSLLLPIALFYVSFFLKNIKWTIFMWIASIIVCFVAGKEVLSFANTLLPSIIEDPRLSHSHTSMEWAEMRVLSNIYFRLDFIIYSAIPIFLGWFYVVKRNFNNKFYIQLFNTYVLSNAIWIAVFMYAPYTNRYAYLSWFIMPLIMIYPLLKEKLIKKQYSFIGHLILGSLLFTWIIFLK